MEESRPYTVSLYEMKSPYILSEEEKVINNIYKKYNDIDHNKELINFDQLIFKSADYTALHKYKKFY